MTTNKITLNPAIVAALLCAAAKNDVRFYLNGLCLENDNGTARATATDGHVLITATDAHSVWSGENNEPAIVQRAELEWALKNTKAGQKIIVHRDGKMAEIVAGNGATMTAALIDGRFPDWRAFVPNGDFSGEEPFVSAVLLGAIAKAGEALKKYGAYASKKYGIYAKLIGNGPRNAAGFRYAGLASGLDVGGVVMPVRADESYARESLYRGLI